MHADTFLVCFFLLKRPVPPLELCDPVRSLPVKPTSPPGLRTVASQAGTLDLPDPYHRVMQSMIRDLPFSNRTFQQRECDALSTPSSECLATTCHLLELLCSHLKSLSKGSHPWGDAEGAGLHGPFSPAHHPVGRKLPPPPDAFTPCSLPRCSSLLLLCDGYSTLQYPGASVSLLFLGLSDLLCSRVL